MINTLFASHLIESKGRTEPDISPRQTTEIHGKSQSKLALHMSHMLEEKLTISHY